MLKLGKAGKSMLGGSKSSRATRKTRRREPAEARSEIQLGFWSGSRVLVASDGDWQIIRRMTRRDQFAAHRERRWEWTA